MMGKIRDILRDYLDNETMARLKKTYEGKISDTDLGRLKEQIEERLDPNQIEGFRQVCKAMDRGQRRNPEAGAL
jgi:hypothetical protein